MSYDDEVNKVNLEFQKEHLENMKLQNELKRVELEIQKKYLSEL